MIKIFCNLQVYYEPKTWWFFQQNSLANNELVIHSVKFIQPALLYANPDLGYLMR